MNEYDDEFDPNGDMVHHDGVRVPYRRATLRELADHVCELEYRLNEISAIALSAARQQRTERCSEPLTITLPVADTMKEVAREAVRQSARKLASKDLIAEQAERAIRQSIVDIIEKSLGKNSSGILGRDPDVLRDLKAQVLGPLTQKLADHDVVSTIIDAALDQIAYMLDPSSSWTRDVVQKTVAALEEEVRHDIQEGVRALAKSLTEKVLSEVIDSALREEMPALDQLQALLLLGIGDRS